MNTQDEQRWLEAREAQRVDASHRALVVTIGDDHDQAALLLSDRERPRACRQVRGALGAQPLQEAQKVQLPSEETATSESGWRYAARIEAMRGRL